MRPISTCLWFDGQAEDAARFYTSIIPNSGVDEVARATADTPSGPKGSVLTVSFRLNGRPFIGLNGGADFTFNEAVSFVVDCEDQAEVDHYWEALTADGGSPGPCGWLKDRFGVSWQVIPARLPELINGADPAGSERAMKAMLQMSKLDVDELERAYADTAGDSARA